MSESKFIENNQLLRLEIYKINFDREVVFAKPYIEKKIKKSFEVDQEVVGSIIKIKPYGIMVKTNGEEVVMVHRTMMQKFHCSPMDFVLGDSITLRKIGYDEVHNKDVWDLIAYNLRSPRLEMEDIK